MLTTLEFCWLDSKVPSKNELIALLNDNITNVGPLYQLKHEHNFAKIVFDLHVGFPDVQSWADTGFPDVQSNLKNNDTNTKICTNIIYTCRHNLFCNKIIYMCVSLDTHMC